MIRPRAVAASKAIIDIMKIGKLRWVAASESLRCLEQACAVGALSTADAGSVLGAILRRYYLKPPWAHNLLQSASELCCILKLSTRLQYADNEQAS